MIERTRGGSKETKRIDMSARDAASLNGFIDCFAIHTQVQLVLSLILGTRRRWCVLRVILHGPLADSSKQKQGENRNWVRHLSIVVSFIHSIIIIIMIFFCFLNKLLTAIRDSARWALRPAFAAALHDTTETRTLDVSLTADALVWKQTIARGCTRLRRLVEWHHEDATKFRNRLT